MQLNDMPIFEDGDVFTISEKPTLKRKSTKDIFDDISKKNEQVFNEIDTVLKESRNSHTKYFDKLIKHRELFAVFCGYRADMNLDDPKQLAKLKEFWSRLGNDILTGRVGYVGTSRERMFENIFYHLSNYIIFKDNDIDRINALADDLFEIIQESSKGKEKLKELLGKGGKSTVCEDYLQNIPVRGDTLTRSFATTARVISRADRDFGAVVTPRWESMEIIDADLPI